MVTAQLTEADPLRRSVDKSKPRKRRTWRFWLGYAVYCVLCTAAILGVAEVVLRVVFGLPTGRFANIARTTTGELLWPASQRLEMNFGPIPYVVETNSLGFRGAEIAPVKPEGTVRIAAVGDSITDGFFVDNDDTFPNFLQAYLTAQDCRAEVINAGKGGASIDREFTILSHKVMPLRPDIVLLTFYSNDIYELQSVPREKLLCSAPLQQPTGSPWRLAAYRTTMHSALAEFVMDGYLRARFENYRRSDRRRDVGVGKGRYDIPGAADHQRNVEIFRQAYSARDGLCLTEPFSDGTLAVIDNYTDVLGHMHRFCQANHAGLVFVYFPAYPQVYDQGTSSGIQDRLRQECRRRGIPFCDLTPAFRRRAEQELLYLAPLDFHPNPAGNRLIGQKVGEFLLAERLISDPNDRKMD